MTVISQSDIVFLTQQPLEKISLIVSGMAALLQDTENKVSAMQSQGWFQRMAKTLSGKNKLTVEDIRKNHDKLNAYMAEAIAILYNQNKIDQMAILSLGAQLNEVYAEQVRLKDQLGSFISKLNDKINSVDNFHMLNTEIEQGVYSAFSPLVGITLVLSQFDNRMLTDLRKLEIIKRSLIAAGIVDSEARPIADYLSDVLLIPEEDVGKVYLEWGAIRGNYVADILSGMVESYFFLPDMARKMKKKEAILESVIQAEGIDDSITLSIEEIYDDFLGSKLNGMRVALPTAEEQSFEVKESVQVDVAAMSTPSNEELARNYEKIHKTAEQGNAEAQFLLGKCYAFGLGTEKNMEQAVDWYRKSAEQGNAKAQNNLGNCYLWGEGVDEDYEEAARWFTKSAEQGRASGQYNLGTLYLSGRGVEKDNRKGVELFLAAAEQGYELAQFDLGRCYDNGWGVLENKEKAFEWYLKAANQGNEDAQYLLGVCYALGNGTKENRETAVYWFKKAAENDQVDAVIALADCYIEGNGVEEDEAMAFELYQKAAAQGDSQAMYQLGRCYDFGWGTEADERRAFEFYKEAYANGCDQALGLLAYDYYYGAGVEEDKAKGFEYFQKAASMDDVFAQKQLAKIYSSDMQDEQKSFLWYQKAADSGDPAAQYELGQKYRDGTGVIKNTIKAFDLFQQAADQGNADALSEVGRCYLTGTGVQKDKAKAFDLFQTAAEMGSSEAVYRLGNCYRYGEGVKVNWDLAKQYYDLAAEMGNASAHFWLAFDIDSEFTFSFNKRKFLNSEQGAKMLEHYKRAAELGSSGAKSRLEELKKYY